MGVPALFRWLSKKYPKIVEPVVEDVPIQNEVDGGFEEVPLDMSLRNPNGIEFDNLYLDMNGIVHPCTHPEGKKPPETEAEMMIEVFKYTERVVNMVRPRKLLMIAIDGVAPRAKMNQQRSRRFRAAQEAKVKEEEKQAAIEEWKTRGKELSEEYKSDKKAWDSNAITPGTPFMTLLTESLRYWIVHKMNTDKGWKQIQVILSDASVPGEGEHKIMDFVRRQRTQPGYDPNTHHVIYGLDADLIMLSLATHEPHFKVLREDVFADQKKGRGCYTCGQMDHQSAQCQGKPKPKGDAFDTIQKPVERKPFIFLDVGTLREYLAVELDLSGLPFPFDLERAIDDWVLLIFFVGNDFLPHLPSLEIREGAIDTLLKIWKTNLARMGGYLTDCGRLNLKRTEVILDGLAAREDDIFRRRREAEQRQDRDAKRRKIESESKLNDRSPPNSHSSYVSVRPTPAQSPSSFRLPSKPGSLANRPNGSESNESTIPGLGAPTSPSTTPVSMRSNVDVVKNRFAIRAANLDAAAMLKAELSGKLDIPASAPAERCPSTLPESPSAPTGEVDLNLVEGSAPIQASAVPDVTSPQPQQAQKRKVDELTADPLPEELVEDIVVLSEDEDEEEEAGNVSVFVHGQPSRPPPLKMLGNNMVEQDDTVKLWEPDYRERYFRQKFGLELSDQAEIRKIVKHYVEGLAWVLAYYYQGCQSWHWFYPYHYSPFAADFTRLDELDIKFDIGQPFRPYEQLMGVFPAASRSHIPSPFHELMISDDSPIKDFYPEDFEIDMNGKKMLWQGIALLPFIEQDRLLSSMKEYEDKLGAEDKQRNEIGDVVMFCGEGHPQYDNLCKLYRKRDATEPVTLDPASAKGVFGSALPDSNCIPGSTFYSPLPTVGLPDIANDKSLFARFFVPPQLVPHRSVLLDGVKLAQRTLNNNDRDFARRGGNGPSGRGGHSYGDGFHQQRQDMGDGPGIMTNYSPGNFSRGGGPGYSSPYRIHNGPQQYQHPQQTYNNGRGHMGRAGGRGPHDAYAGYNSGSGGLPHRGGHGSFSGRGYTPPGGQHARPTGYSNEGSRGGYRGGYDSRPSPASTRPYGGASYGDGYGRPPSASSGYGGTGVGLPQRPASFGTAYGAGGPGYGGYPQPTPPAAGGRGGYRPPGLVPAVTRPGYNQQQRNQHPSQLPPPHHGGSSRR